MFSGISGIQRQPHPLSVVCQMSTITKSNYKNATIDYTIHTCATIEIIPYK